MTAFHLPLIDCHTHIGRLPGVVGEEFGAQDLLYIAEREGVGQMLVSSASTTTVGREYGLREALDMARQHGERLRALLWVNPHDPAWSADLDEAARHGFCGLKIHPVLDHYAVTLDALDGVFACARVQGWPILTHTGEDGTSTSASHYEPLIDAYPEVTLILAHLRLEAIPLAKRYRNVYLDTTYVSPLMVEVGVDAVGAGKILFGSDAAEGFDVGRPTVRSRPRRSYAGIIADWRARGIPDSAMERILHHNARTVYRLE